VQQSCCVCSRWHASNVHCRSNNCKLFGWLMCYADTPFSR
jgi:hypothetical protein